MKRSIFAFAILALLWTGAIARAATFQVTPNGGSDCNTGSCDLQSALDVAVINGEDNVLNLAAGKYDAGPGTFTYIPSFPTGSLTLVGDPGGGTIIDGNGNQGMSIDTFSGGAPDASSGISISGVTFQKGVTSNFGSGLGIITNNADAHVDHCKFLSNVNETVIPGRGGGGLAMLIQGFGTLELEDSEFRNNSTASTGGGAIAVSVGGDVSLNRNIFVGNSALQSAGGGGGGGGFALSVAGSVMVGRNIFLNNKAALAGGGFLGESISGSGVFTDNIVSGNEVLSDGSNPSLEAGGGVLWVTGISLDFTNNTVVGNNILNGDGGGAVFSLFAQSAIGNIYNNIIFGNTASGGINCTTSCNDILVLDNGGGTVVPPNVGSIVNVFNNDYSDIFFQCDPSQGCVPHQNVGQGTNINADPLFVGPGNGNFHLSPTSPALDKGSASAPHLPTEDFDGNPRSQGLAPDMGALEFAPGVAAELCANNVDDDGDLKVDCLDPDCTGSDACQGVTPPGSENCANNLDDDGDGLTDCGDPNCNGAVACKETNPPPSGGSENCSNNVDDDDDGQIDCNDSDCAGACQNGGGGGGTSAPQPNVSVNGGCAVAPSAHFSFPFVFLGAPLLWALGRRRVKV